MTWIESHTVLSRHRKLMQTAEAMRLRPVYLMGHLHALWHNALEQQEDGDLSKWTDKTIAEASQFPGDAQTFVQLLSDHGWLNNRLLHDWLDYAGRYLESKYRSKRPERLAEIWARHGRKWVKSGNKLEKTQDGPGAAHLPNLPTYLPAGPPGAKRPKDCMDCGNGLAVFKTTSEAWVCQSCYLKRKGEGIA